MKQRMTLNSWCDSLLRAGVIGMLPRMAQINLWCQPLCFWMVWRPETRQSIGASAGHTIRIQSKGIMTRLGTQSHFLVIPQEFFVFALLIWWLYIWYTHSIFQPWDREWLPRLVDSLLLARLDSELEWLHESLLVDFCGNLEHDEKIGLIIR